MNFSEFSKNIKPTLPNSPGVYQFINSNNSILYIGKAKNLKNRVSSYFKKDNNRNYRLRTLVEQSIKIDYILVNTEQDALLLENTLIKKHQPKYNIQLKDDKSYPYICIKNERFPRVFLTRQLVIDGSLYFGPYTSVRTSNTLLELINKLFQLRNCNLNLSEYNISRKKFKICLEYQIKNCLGPCEGLQGEQDYLDSIQQIKSILKGNRKVVIDYLNDKMKRLSNNYEYENAAIIKNKISILKEFQTKSTIVNPKLDRISVFSVQEYTNTVFINRLDIIMGSIIQVKNIKVTKEKRETTQDIFEFVINEFINSEEIKTTELIVPYQITINNKILLTIPIKGDKLRLLNLSKKNSLEFKKKYISDKERKLSKYRQQKLNLNLFKETLKLKSLPNRIECFDNSNIQGHSPVASMVVFKKLSPSYKDYRHYNIKTVTGPNDFDSMAEVIYRRYKRILNEQKTLPDLIVIDGGKGQLSAAYKSLQKLKLERKLVIISIAKREELIYYPNDSQALQLDKANMTLKVIQNLRDEAHRFAISFHRNKRSKDQNKTLLQSIPGIGKSTAKKLLTEFKSVNKIKSLKLEELTNIIGIKKAEIIYNEIISANF